MNRQGMSQILGLIIAATVFMIAAISLIVIFNSGIFDSTESADRQACSSTINTICQTGAGSTAPVPSSCDGLGGNVKGLSSSGEIVCSQLEEESTGVTS